MEWNPAVWVSQSKAFFGEVRTEFRKIAWPSQKETVAGTIGVVVIVAVITLVLGLMDAILGQLMRWVLP